MGKGSQTVTQNQTYQADPRTASAASQLGVSAQGLPGPGNVPLQGVQGFSGDQYDAFQNVRNLQGMSNPYFQAASGYINQGATPITAAETQNYFNPYFQQQMAALNDQLGAKNVQARGSEVQSAGGMGADRLGVAEAERFRQDQLARGQLAGNTYQAALGAAQQDKQRQEAAGALMGSLGPAALGANLQETSALYNMGSQQQQLGQAGLNAQYGQQLGQYQNPYQNLAAQQQATATMAGALGGTQTQTKTLPAASPWGSILGLAGTAAGAFFGGPAGASVGGQLGSALGGGSGKGSNQGFNSYTQPNYYSQNYGSPNQLFPGYGSGMAAGGAVNPYDVGQGFQAGGDIDATDITLDEDALGLGKPWEPTNPAIEADSGFPSTSALGFSGAPPPVGPRTAMPSMEPQAPQGGIPSLPNVPAGAGPSRASNPWTALMQAGLATMAASGRRDQHGIPLSPLAAVGEGGMAGIKTLQQQQASNREERRVQMEAERLLEQAKMARLPYSQMTAAQKAADVRAREQIERPYQEMTAAQRAQESRLGRTQELESLKPFKIGVDPETFVDVYAIRDPKTGELKKIDPATGKAGEVIPEGGAPDGSGKKIGGMTQEALAAAAERYRITGQFPPNTGRGLQGRAQKLAIENEAARLDKEQGVDPATRPQRWQEFKAQQIAIQRFMSGPQGNTTRSLGVVVDHLATARELGDALKNGDVRIFNQLATEWAKQTGQAAPTNFDAVKGIVGTEIIKALGVAGAGTVAERQEAAEAFSRASSPAQLHGAIESVQKLLVGQINGLERQFVASTGLKKEKFRELLPPEALKFYGVEGGSKKELSSQDKAAMDWANKNPQDPRAKEIKKRLGAE